LTTIKTIPSLFLSCLYATGRFIFEQHVVRFKTSIVFGFAFVLHKHTFNMPITITHARTCFRHVYFPRSHLSNDLSKIKYSGYLLKRSNQPYQHNLSAAGITTSAVVPIDPFDVPELPLITASSSLSLLQPKPNPDCLTMMDDALWSDLDSPPESSYVVHGPLHKQLTPTLADDDVQSSRQLPNELPKEKTPLQQGLEFAAAFFGITLEQYDNPSRPERNLDVTTTTTTKVPFQNQHDNKALLPNQGDDDDAKRTMIPPIIQKKVSAPIKVGSGCNSLQSRDSFQESFHKRTSAPMLLSASSADESSRANSPSGFDIWDSRLPPPADFVHAIDGHLWRAKYCVLEEGILYFYRNPTDGESAEAIAERRLSSEEEEDNNNNSSNSNSKTNNPKTLTTYTSKDLSKSPMPRTFHHLNSNSSGDSGSMWEKRVFLDCVAAVRSAEQEHGKNSFELVAVRDDEEEEHGDNNKLVLQAQNSEEMNEWLFQFHRSLASFMMKLLQDPKGGYLDAHNPTFLQQPWTVETPPNPRPLITFSPRFQNTPPITTTLSHGHGRNARHRRRFDLRAKTNFDDGTSSLSSTPDSVRSSGGSPLPFAFRDTPGDHLRSSPTRSPERFWIPPRPDPRPERAPELSAPQSADPETERPIPSKPVHSSGKYIPPHLRVKQSEQGTSGKYIPPHQKKQQQEGSNTPKPRYIPPSMRSSNGDAGNGVSLLTLEERAQSAPDPAESTGGDGGNNVCFKEEDLLPDQLDVVGQQSTPFKLGGCADPQVVNGSILDSTYISKKASKLGPVPTETFGCYGGGDLDADGIFTHDAGKSKLRWELGAVSECGIRNSNEDSYLIASDLMKAFQSLPETHGDATPSSWTEKEADHKPGLFAIFDGHCGDQAARFAVEKLARYIYDESKEKQHPSFENKTSPFDPSNIEEILRDAITKLDREFCHLCVEEGRDWESGATAIVALLANEHLVIANLGDCRGVFCRSVEESEEYVADEEWTELDIVLDDYGRRSTGSIAGEVGRCFWKEMTDIHSPSREDERNRIEEANGWVTTETEIPIGQLRRMDFFDQDVVEILKRCVYDRLEESDRSAKECKAAPQRIIHIARVCGELAVSRALGDRDFKAAFNISSPTDLTSFDNSQWWDCPLCLPYPEPHSGRFQGDLVSNAPEFQTMRVGEKGASDEFLVLACDGLWDVMDQDDAVRVARDLLFRKQWTAKKAVSSNINDCKIFILS
jgi:serine/threonine protein phosphatase PrpC